MSARPQETRLDLYPSRRGAKPCSIERQDPVVHSAHRQGAPLPPQQICDYERNGFLILEQLFDARELELLQEEAAKLRAASGQIDATLAVAEPGDSSLRSVFHVHEISPLLRRIAHDARLVDLAEYILGDRVYVHQSRLNYKPGLSGKEFYWHSDFETWHVEDGMPRMRALSVSISLVENTALNGPLMLIPGSHRRYLSCVGETPEEHFRQSLRKQEYGVPDPEALTAFADDGGITAATGPAGTVALFDCNTMHGSNGNITPYPRSNLFIVYNSVSNTVEAPFGPTEPRPEFLAERSDFEHVKAISGPIRSV